MSATTEPHLAPDRSRVPASSVLLVLGLAALWLALWLFGFGTAGLHVQGPFVDQAGYITTARHLADTGELRSGLVMPTYIENPRWRPYMPGHYAALAASYRALGFSTCATLLPNVLAFLLSTVLVHRLAARVYGRRAAGPAALFFAVFPGNVLFAGTAMAEPTFTAAGLVGFTLFLAAPVRWRPLAAPLCLVLPFLFRETGALWVLPMLAFLLLERSAPTSTAPASRRLPQALAALVAAVLLLAGLNAWQIADGKGVVPLSWIQRGTFAYNDATLEAEIWTLAQWAQGIAANFARNLGEVGRQTLERPFSVGVVGFWWILGAWAGATALALKRRARDPLAVGASLLGLAMLLAVFGLYDVKAQKGMRSLVFVYPLCALAVSGAFARRPASAGKRRLVTGVAVASAGFLALFPAANELTFLDEATDRATRTIEELGHDDATMLMVDIRLTPFLLDYAVRHYPVPWSFAPENDATLKLFEGRYRVGTLLLHDGAFGPITPPRTAFDGRLRFEGKVELGHPDYLTGVRDFLVYRR